MKCIRCDGSGFLNLFQVPEEIMHGGIQGILKWSAEAEGYDVQICDCCGNGEEWYGIAGEHYSAGLDPRGKSGPYAYNGGLCECH